MKVVPFETHPRSENVKVALGHLTKLIDEDAVVSVGIATVLRDGSIETIWSAGIGGPLLGAVSRLAHRVNIDMDGQ